MSTDAFICRGYPVREDELTLPAAVRPGGRGWQGRTGYRLEQLELPNGQRLPMLAAAVSAEQVFGLFLDLLKPLGEVVDVVIERQEPAAPPRRWRRSAIDRVVLCSHLAEFEELLTDDGYLSVAVVAHRRQLEVQLDDHKLLHVYGRRLCPFRRLLRQAGIRPCRRLTLICETAHWHHTCDPDASRTRSLVSRLAAYPEAARQG